jgi:hypothetical protein
MYPPSRKGKGKRAERGKGRFPFRRRTRGSFSVPEKDPRVAFVERTIQTSNAVSWVVRNALFRGPLALSEKDPRVLFPERKTARSDHGERWQIPGPLGGTEKDLWVLSRSGVHPEGNHGERWPIPGPLGGTEKDLWVLFRFAWFARRNAGPLCGTEKDPEVRFRSLLARAGSLGGPGSAPLPGPGPDSIWTQVRLRPDPGPLPKRKGTRGSFSGTQSGPRVLLRPLASACVRT